MKAGRNLWGHCDREQRYFSEMKKKNLLIIVILNERVEGEAAIRHDILHSMGREILFRIIRDKSENFENGCLWQP